MRQLDNAAIRVETGFASRKLVIEAATGEQFVVELTFEQSSLLVGELTIEPPVQPVPEPEPAPPDPVEPAPEAPASPEPIAQE